MLYSIKDANSIVNPISFFYNSQGTFCCIALEDLTSMVTLFQLLTNHKLEKQKKLMVARNMCRSIAELHTLEIAHGDLSSENIMVDFKRC